jgi:dynein assembly factor 1
MKLENLQLQRNRIGGNGIEDVIQLKALQSISSLDISHNQIDIFPVESFIDILKSMPNLKVLYMQNNPICKNISHYRKTLIHNLENLKYLDDKPVFEEERRFATAFFRGGIEEERRERDMYRKEQEEFHMQQHEMFRKLYVDK